MQSASALSNLRIRKILSHPSFVLSGGFFLLHSFSVNIPFPTEKVFVRYGKNFRSLRKKNYAVKILLYIKITFCTYLPHVVDIIAVSLHREFE